MSYSVGQVSRYAKVTVRTLHHYDEIALLSPSGRSPAGYRRYEDVDLDRLQQILFYRELGFSLDDIASILDDSGISPGEHLRRQRRLLLGRIDRLQEMVVSVNNALEARRMGVNLTPEEKFEVFGQEYVEHEEEYQDEAEARWGHTEAWAQSKQRTARYTKADWERIQAEAEDVNRRIAEAIRDGIAPTSETGMAVAEEHRLHITRWFYDTPYEMHRCLGEMYVADPRFTATYEKVAPGAAAWFQAAISANADRGTASPAAG